HLLALGLTDSRDEFVKRLSRCPLFQIAIRDAIDRLGNAFRRHRADRETVRSGVIGPLASQDHLEMWHCVSVLVPADTVEAQIGDMMLAAGIEAAADLDVESADSLIHFEAALGEPHAQLA